jgi:uncharacterized protein GlcG (DUF336 family)
LTGPSAVESRWDDGQRLAFVSDVEQRGEACLFGCRRSLRRVVAMDKAWTAASFGMSTHQWNHFMSEPMVAPLGQHPRLMAVGGGVPIMLDGKLAGGIGISGGTSAQDHEAAEDALRALGLLG